MVDDVQNNAIVAEIGAFSGFRNPTLSLTGSAADQFANLVRQTVNREPIHPPPPPKLGHYYGFLVRMPAELARQLGIPPRLRAYQAVLTEGDGREQKHWRDVSGVERFLTGEAYQQGHGEILKKLGVERSGDAVRP
ncbi:MAG: hypothetical protein WCE79_22890 [Xanthobacteraceae bacterium]